MLNELLLFTEFKQKLNKAIEYIRGEIVNIRGGKPSSSLVENLIVDVYEGTAKLKLMELASIMTEGASGLLINPYDQSTIKDIEKAILVSPLHLTPRVDGHSIHIVLPLLSEEQRQKLVKIVSQKIEEGKVRLRATRDEIRRKIKTAFEAKDLAEDQKFRREKEIDKIIQDYSIILDNMEEKKTKEICSLS